MVHDRGDGVYGERWLERRGVDERLIIDREPLDDHRLRADVYRPGRIGQSIDHRHGGLAIPIGRLERKSEHRCQRQWLDSQLVGGQCDLVQCLRRLVRKQGDERLVVDRCAASEHQLYAHLHRCGRQRNANRHDLRERSRFRADRGGDRQP